LIGSHHLLTQRSPVSGQTLASESRHFVDANSPILAWIHLRLWELLRGGVSKQSRSSSYLTIVYVLLTSQSPEAEWAMAVEAELSVQVFSAGSALKIFKGCLGLGNHNRRCSKVPPFVTVEARVGCTTKRGVAQHARPAPRTKTSKWGSGLSRWRGGEPAQGWSSAAQFST
jgi:hypothetical protein